MGNLGLANIVEVKKFQTDDEDRIRGCYNSHIEIYKEIASRYKGASDYSVLVLEDNISQSPLLSQSTLSNLASFQSRRQGGRDMLHLAYIMYVPGLQVTKTDMGGVVSLKTGEQAALGTTAYVISKRGVDALLEYHEKVRMGRGGGGMEAGLVLSAAVPVGNLGKLPLYPRHCTLTIISQMI